MKKTLGFAALLAALFVSGYMPVRHALAAAPVGGGPETSTVTVRETIACNSGVSPCSVAASATTIMNANTSRHSACVQHTGTAGTAFCTLGAVTPSAVVHDFAIGFPGNTTGLPTAFCFSGGVTVWGGTVSCFGAAGVSLDVVAY